MAITLICVYLIVGLAGVFGSPPLQTDLSSQFEASSGPSPNLFAGVRLSQDLYPVHYDLKIRPILDLSLDDPLQFTAPGEVKIRLRVVNPTNNITLHASDMEIDYNNVLVKIADTDTSIQILTDIMNPAMSTYTVLLEQELDTAFEYELTIPFVAKVGDRLSGLYRSSYLDESGNQRWLATTQFQKLGARMAFPCFDEPNFKSTFSIAIGRTVGYHTLSNSPLLQSEPIPDLPNWQWDVHEVTVKMPTYLIAIIVSDFVSISSPAGITEYDVKIWGPPTATNEATAAFAASSSAQILEFFEIYLQSPYQFTKLDSAAIADFSPGAMENWALNTYRLNYLLYIDEESTQNDKWGIARILAHEISHHWFGDLVTCNWWNDLWLNEGFASYMEILGGVATGFDIDGLDRYPVDKIQVAMAFDAGSTTEPVHSNNTEIVNSQAGTIVYQKAASLIRMIQSFLTEETFIAAVRSYLVKYAYENVEQDDLFAELQAQADADGTLVDYSVKAVVDSWTLQTGFPIVSVTWFPDHILFRHELFSNNPPHWDETATQAPGLWYTPIAWTKQSNPDFSQASWKPQLWFEPGVQNVSRTDLVADDEWIVVNPDARSYFRTIYCSHFINLLIIQLETNHTAISANTRSQIIDDVFKTAFTNGWENAQIKNALDVTTYLDAEDNTAVWLTVFNNLRPINRYLIDSPFYESFKTYVLSKVTPALDRIGWEQNSSDAPKTVILRTQLLDWACSLGTPNCDTVAVGYVDGLGMGTPVPADLQPVIFCKAVSLWESLEPGQFDISGYLLEQYKTTTREERFTVILNALACDPTLEVESLDVLTSPDLSPFSVAHTISFMQRLGENPVNRQLILEYFLTNLADIILRLGESTVSRVVSSIAAYTSEAQVSAQANALIESSLEVVTSESVRNSLLQSRTALDNNRVWIGDWGQKIGDWLLKH